MTEPFSASSNAEIYIPDLLAQSGLAFNNKLGLVICLKCGVAVTSSRLKDHATKKHGLDRNTVNPILALISEECKAADKYPETTFPKPVQPYEGLPVVDNYLGCPECSYAAKDEKTMKRHLKTHKGATGAPLKNVLAQTLNALNKTGWFQVTVSPKFSVFHSLLTSSPSLRPNSTTWL